MNGPNSRLPAEARLARAVAARRFVAAYLAGQHRRGRAIRARDLAWQRERERREMADQIEACHARLDDLEAALRPIP